MTGEWRTNDTCCTKAVWWGDNLTNYFTNFSTTTATVETITTNTFAEAEWVDQPPYADYFYSETYNSVYRTELSDEYTTAMLKDDASGLLAMSCGATNSWAVMKSGTAK